MDDKILLRFWSKVIVKEGCWGWSGTVLKKDNRAVFCVHGKTIIAARFSWEVASKKKIPHGMFACHKCDNPECTNPDHIFIGTRVDNAQDCIRKGRFKYPPRDVWAGRTHCKNGHEFTPENTAKHRNGNARRCKMCNKLRTRIRRGRFNGKPYTINNK